jgi:hypothetical protein
LEKGFSSKGESHHPPKRQEKGKLFFFRRDLGKQEKHNKDEKAITTPATHTDVISL